MVRHYQRKTDQNKAPKETLKDESLVAQRIVCAHVRTNGSSLPTKDRSEQSSQGNSKG